MDGSPEQEELGQIHVFRRQWLQRLGLSAKNARLMVVKGDAMAPTLVAGDTILIDTSVDDVEELGIYVIRADDRLMIKRIVPKLDGSLQVMSDNPLYAPEQVSQSEATALRIVGQVRWFGRSI
jgi:phage repressor protein C with HTH and peptisase S24 domain